jgi:hypothetical protein
MVCGQWVMMVHFGPLMETLCCPQHFMMTLFSFCECWIIGNFMSFEAKAKNI